jgi:hypothetical protein
MILAAPKDPLELLAPYMRRRVSTFLKKPEAAEPAFWDVVYPPGEYEHSVCVAVADQMERTSKTVAAVVDGWRPKLLQP